VKITRSKLARGHSRFSGGRAPFCPPLATALGWGISGGGTHLDWCPQGLRECKDGSDLHWNVIKYFFRYAIVYRKYRDQGGCCWDLNVSMFAIKGQPVTFQCPHPPNRQRIRFSRNSLPHKVFDYVVNRVVKRGMTTNNSHCCCCVMIRKLL